jgi:hypothetical protein
MAKKKKTKLPKIETPLLKVPESPASEDQELLSEESIETAPLQDVEPIIPPPSPSTRGQRFMGRNPITGEDVYR